LQRLACSVTYALEVVLIARLVSSGDEIVDEGLPKVRTAIELVLQEAEKPLMTYLIKNNREIISHYMLITCGGLDGDLVERDPAFGVLLAIIFAELFELEIPWPDDLLEMSKLFETRGAVFNVILDVAHVLVGLAVISTTSDLTADIARRKMVTGIVRRVLVDLLISIATTIAVVVTMTLTTFFSAFIAAVTTATATAATTWGRIVAMLVTWML
jgi:phage-related holin